MSKPTFDHTSFRIRTHGDSHEKRFADFLERDVPTYEPFWQRFVVPLTFRVLNREHPYVRPSIKSEYADYVDASYAMMWQLTWAWQHNVDLTGTSVDKRVDRTRMLYGFLSHIRSFCDTAARFASTIDGVGGTGKPFGSKLDPDGHHYIFNANSKAAKEVISEMTSLRNDVRVHRNAVIHNLPLYVINDRIPSATAIRKNTSKLGLTTLGQAVKRGVRYPVGNLKVDSWSARTISDACLLGTSMWQLATDLLTPQLSINQLTASGLDEDRDLTIERFNEFFKRDKNSG